MASFEISERRACRALGVPRSTQRYVGIERGRGEALLFRIRALARENPRHGYRRITALLRREGWSVNLKRAHRPWRGEGLRVPQAQRRRRHLGHPENSCTGRRAERPNHMWGYDFPYDQTADGRQLKVLPIVDEFTRECLAIEVERSMGAEDVVSTPGYSFEIRGEPEHIRSDNGPEFIARAVRSWLARRGSGTLYVAPAGPRENAYSETSNGRFRDELLGREVFGALKEAKVPIEGHRLGYNHRRPHSSPGYRTPVEFAAAQIKPGVASPPAEAVPDPRPRTLITPGPEFGDRSVARARMGDWSLVLTPTKPVPPDWFPPLAGLDVLCLASGGGQRGAILAAAGANVTVFDNSPNQLAQDRMVADREGLTFETVLGDMADLSAFPDARFDLIFHPVSNVFAPDIRPVWKEAFRVLRPGASLLSGFMNPVQYLFDDIALEQGELRVAHRIPYSDLDGPTEEEHVRLVGEGRPLEFGHTLGDQIGGQIAAGFMLTGFYEDIDPESVLGEYIPSYIATRASRPGS